MSVLVHQHCLDVVVYTLYEVQEGKTKATMAELSVTFSRGVPYPRLNFAFDGWEHAAQNIKEVKDYWDEGYYALTQEAMEKHADCFRSWMKFLTEE